MKPFWSVCFSAIGLAMSMNCQARSVPVARQVLRDLKSGRWQVRRDAFERLQAVKDGIDRPGVQRLLIQLRQREDQESEKADPDLYEDDNYLAYDEELTPLVQKIAVGTNNSRAWRALVYMRYNGDSEYGRWIASHRQCLPFLLEQVRGRSPVRRMYAVYVIASMLAESKSRKPFTKARYKSLKAIIRRLAGSDNDVAVRFSAVQGLGLVDDPEDTEFVFQISEGFSDPHLKALALDIAQKMPKAKQRTDRRHGKPARAASGGGGQPA